MKSWRHYVIVALSLAVIVLVGLLVRMFAFPAYPTVAMGALRPIAELATVEYSTVVEVPNERIPDDIRKMFGAKEQILMLVYGKVKAGFDLNKMADGDLQTEQGTVRLTLPRPEILSLTIDNERTHVVYYEKSWLVGRDVKLESETREMADTLIRQQALDDGILEQAKALGVQYYENHLRSLGFTDVQVVVR
jgi:hypothetical protein